MTEVSLEVTYGDSIAYVGFDNKIASVVTLKHDDKKFHATDMDSQIHKYFNKELYMGITLYDGEGKEKTCNSRRARNFKELCEASEWYAVRVWGRSESIPCRTGPFEMVSK